MAVLPATMFIEGIRPASTSSSRFGSVTMLAGLPVFRSCAISRTPFYCFRGRLLFLLFLGRLFRLLLCHLDGNDMDLVLCRIHVGFERYLVSFVALQSLRIRNRPALVVIVHERLSIGADFPCDRRCLRGSFLSLCSLLLCLSFLSCVLR